ncbi:MAG: S16 family serine protease [Candidatus Anstonellales archaeon]
MRTVLCMLLLFSVVASACEGTVVFYIPAVAGEEGGFVKATLTAGEGNSTYFEIPPYLGITTQNSFITAVNLAEKLAGKECSFGISFPEKEVKNIDGPSGGVMFTIYAYSLLMNMTPREDAMATGSVDESGTVGSVGGVYEKATASKEIGKKYFVAPNPTISEYMLAKDLEDENFTIVYIRRVGEVVDFMFFNITPEGIKLKRTEEIPEENNTWKVDGFDEIAEEMISKEESELNDVAIPQEVYNYVQESIALQKTLLKKGYQYSAANDAFTMLTEIRTLRDSNSKTLKEKEVEVEECLNATVLNEKMENNWEWIAGAEVRKKWAENAVKNVRAARPELKEEEYMLMNKLEYAQGWCEIAKQLNKKGEGKTLNESIYKERAKEVISEVEKEIVTVDAVEHVENAKELYDEGKYLAAGYEALFAKSINDARMEEKTKIGKYETMWGKLYGSQAKFSKGAEVTNLANYLEEFFRESEENAVWEGTEEEKENSKDCAGATVIFIILLTTAIAKSKSLKNRKIS